MRSNRAGVVLALGIGLVLLLSWSARPAGSGLGWRLAFVGLHVSSFAALIVWARTACLSRRLVLAGAVVFRLAALPMAPTLSDDGYRYVWDGLVAGEARRSPYELRPSDPALAELHAEPIYRRLNSPDYYSVYPPASQLVFQLSASVYGRFGFEGSWMLLKALLVAAELVGIVGLLRVARPSRVALYAWSPLAIVEIAGQGHTEALVVAGVVGVVAGVAGRFPVRSLAATVAGATKLYPLALLPHAWRREGWRGVLVSAIVLVSLAAPVWSPRALWHASTSLGLFYGTLDWFSAPYLGLKAVLYPVLGEAAGRAASRLLAGAFGLAVAGAMLADDGTQRAVRVGTALVVTSAALSAATLHPWYLVPVLAIVPLLSSTRTLLYLCTTASLSYLSYELAAPGRLALLVVLWGGAALLGARDWASSRPRPLGEGVE